jgi:outer membrane biosynthesis protein TonB
MYDPELTHFLTIIVTTFISVFWAVCYMYGVCSENVKPLTFSDKFDLGYIDDNEPDTNELVVVNQPKPKTKPKKKKKKKNKQPKSKPIIKSEPNEQLMRDCTSALVGLGIKKMEAKRATTTFLDKNPTVTTVEEFVQGVFRR